ncbi:MAG: VOC family protein [Anaerolineae bacterium]|nr:VOC family protein [Anaerolineae bacterium]
MTMDYKLHHFGLVCQDVEKSLATYCERLGNQLTSRWYNRGLFDVACAGNGTDVTLELVGRPFMPYEEAHIARHGYSINHISFLVDDADGAFEELEAQGVQVAWEPQDWLFIRRCGFYDEDGLLFELFSYLTPLLLAAPDPGALTGQNDLILDHVSILTPDLRRAQRFYTEKLGLKTAYECIEDEGGFVMLIDPLFDFQAHRFMLEIIGPPHLEPREVELLEKRGACYDHLCYIAGDVHAAWQEAIERGVEGGAAPIVYEKYGIRVAWLKDADGNDVEIMDPIPDNFLEMALQAEEPLNVAQM